MKGDPSNSNLSDRTWLLLTVVLLTYGLLLWTRYDMSLMEKRIAYLESKVSP